MKAPSFSLVAGVVVVVAVGVGWGIGSRKRTASPPLRTDRGGVVYQVSCASCHGAEGHGDGTGASALKPAPRDFASRPWRYEPTLESIRRVTRDGSPGTGMPSFGTALSEGDLEAVVAHVHRLATASEPVERFRTEPERLLFDAGFEILLGTPAPPLTLVDAKDRTVRLSDLKGRPLMLHFWGTNCAPCIREIPTLNLLANERGFELLHVCAEDDDPMAAQKFLDRHAPGSTAWAEADGIGLARYEVRSLPCVWLVAPDGTAFGRTSGAKDWSGEPMRKLLAAWLTARPLGSPN